MTRGAPRVRAKMDDVGLFDHFDAEPPSAREEPKPKRARGEAAAAPVPSARAPPPAPPSAAAPASTAPAGAQSAEQTAPAGGKTCKHDVAMPPGLECDDDMRDLTVGPREPARLYPFELDPFQRAAVACIEREESVLVSAHTSAGKTVCAEYAIGVCLRDKQRVIYTSPIKALSNQKYRELFEAFGDVGLMTVAHRRRAPPPHPPSACCLDVRSYFAPGRRATTQSTSTPRVS